MTFFMRYTDEKPLAAIKAAIMNAQSAASREFRNMSFDGEWATSGYGITTIRPYHIQAGGANWGSSNYWASCFAASVTWEDWINITQTDLAFEIICGMFNLEASPKTTDVSLEAAGKTLPSLNIEETYAMDISRFYWAKPVVIYPSKPWKFQHKGIDTGVEREGLVGWTMATQAFLILRN
jgi:hypothetical protein